MWCNLLCYCTSTSREMCLTSFLWAPSNLFPSLSSCAYYANVWTIFFFLFFLIHVKRNGLAQLLCALCVLMSYLSLTLLSSSIYCTKYTLNFVYYVYNCIWALVLISISESGAHKKKLQRQPEHHTAARKQQQRKTQSIYN